MSLTEFPGAPLHIYDIKLVLIMRPYSVYSLLV